MAWHGAAVVIIRDLIDGTRTHSRLIHYGACTLQVQENKYEGGPKILLALLTIAMAVHWGCSP